MLKLTLASQSRHKSSVLAKLGIPFDQCNPDINEAERPGESAVQLASRLARQKAMAAAQQVTDGYIIAADQTVSLNGTLLHKPLTHEKATEQLAACSGQRLTFHSGLCLYHANTLRHLVAVDDYHVHFRQLTLPQIDNYLKLDQPYDCVGSFKSEAAGILLFEKLEGDDPNSLIGLPLLKLNQLFQKFSVDLLSVI